jgi:hypothetical protein
MRRISISYELRENRCYSGFIRRLECLGASPVMNTQWVLQTSFTIEDIERDLRSHLDPADRLLVTHFGAMSSRNLINTDKFGGGAV